MLVRPATQLLVCQITRSSKLHHIRGLVEARHVTGDETEDWVNFEAVGRRHLTSVPVARYRIVAFWEIDDPFMPLR